jgi:endonuclease YncB( thermonuclease family)
MSVSSTASDCRSRHQFDADLRLLRRAHVARRSVLDGGGTSIRLHGIDAPELKQTCDG